MLNYLKEKRDAGFFKSLSGLMQSCRSVLWYYSSWKQTHDSYAHIWFWGSSPSVLDLNAFERQNKAEGLGMVTEEGSSKWSGLSLDALCDIYFVFSFKLHICERFLLRFSEQTPAAETPDIILDYTQQKIIPFPTPQWTNAEPCQL